MRHRKGGYKLNRTIGHRKALFRNLLTSLFEYEKIQTTTVKAKAIRSLADRLVTLAKRGDLAARRQVAKVIFKPSIVKKIFEEMGSRFKSRSGGYTRIYKIGYRVGDAAELSLIELIMDEASKSSQQKPLKEDKDSGEKAATKQDEKSGTQKAEQKEKKVAKKNTKKATKKDAKKDKDKEKKKTQKKQVRKEAKKSVKTTTKKSISAKKTTTKVKKSSANKKKG